MGKLLIITGPSGSGKSTVAKLLNIFYGIPEIVSYSTRQIRKGEINGVSYHFVSKDEFDLIPMVENVEYGGNYYGISEESINQAREREGLTCVVCEEAGAEQLSELLGKDFIDRIYVDIDKEFLRERFIFRGDDEKNIEKRLALYDKDVKMRDKAHFIVKNNGTPVSLMENISILMKHYE